MISEKQTAEFDARIQKEFDDAKKNIKKPNILLVGGTGVGKSSIVNMIFGVGTAKVGSGEPVTRGINKIDQNKDVVLYDTEGFEIGVESEKMFNENIVGFVNKKKKGGFENQIHLVWFVISGSSDRVTDYDIKLLNDLKGLGVPVAVIFSKCDNANEESLNNMIIRLYPMSNFEIAFKSDSSPFFTTTDKQAIKEEPNLDIKKVIDWSIEMLPAQLKEAFIASQQVSLEAKFESAKSIVLQHSGANALIGGSPIPFSDAPVLILSQAGMIGRIVNLYGIENFGITDFMKGTGGGIVVSNIGRSIAGNLIKIIPGVGTVIGGLINSFVAAAITYGMGTATNMIMRDILYSQLAGEKDKVTEILENFGPMFKDYFKKSYESYKSKN
jgi:uncharacterized protein (DUF697 family)/GTP-binding protein EngB required for normal cell division